MTAKDLIKRHEGLRLTVYEDTCGLPTIGYGFNLEGAGAQAVCARLGLDYSAIKSGASITEAQADAVLDFQLSTVASQAKVIFPAFDSMPQLVQCVVQDLIFNMGAPRFDEFHVTIAALRAGDWRAAAAALQDSLWYTQVGSRGSDDVNLLRNA